MSPLFTSYHFTLLMNVTTLHTLIASPAYECLALFTSYRFSLLMTCHTRFARLSLHMLYRDVSTLPLLSLGGGECLHSVLSLFLLMNVFTLPLLSLLLQTNFHSSHIIASPVMNVSTLSPTYGSPDLSPLFPSYRFVLMYMITLPLLSFSCL